METPTGSVKEPQGWQEASNWLKQLTDIESPSLQDKFGESLLGTTSKTDMPMDRISSGLLSLFLVSNSWEKFSTPFVNEKHAKDFLNAIVELKNKDEKLSIRALDIVFGRKRQFGDEVSSILSGMDDINFTTFINELRSNDSVLLSDNEMDKLNSPGISVNVSKVPARYILAGLYNGGSGVDETKNSFGKAVDYYKSNILPK